MEWKLEVLIYSFNSDHLGSVKYKLSDAHSQGFSYLSKSGSRGCLIWEKQLANIQNWETGLEKLNSLFYCIIIQKHGKLHHRTIKSILNFVSRNIH